MKWPEVTPEEKKSLRWGAIIAVCVAVFLTVAVLVTAPAKPHTPAPTPTRAPGLYPSSQHCSPDGASRMGTQNSMGFDVCINGYWYVSYR